MTQTPRTPIKWIVPVPDNDPFGRKTFTMVCRGNADIGSVLNYFVYEASRKVEREETDISKIESVTLENRQQDVIAQRAGVSKKTLIAHIKKLVEWNLIVADAYRHHYEVYHKNIAKDILHPPEEIKPKLRGIHVANCKSTISTIPEGITLEAFQQMWQEIVDLRSESVKQHTTIVDLQNEIVRLHSVQSAEGASQQGVNPVFDTPNSSNSNQEIEESIDASFVASPPSSSSFASENESHSQQEPTLPIASRHYETSNSTDVTQVSQESEPPAHGHTINAAPRLPGDNQRGTAGTQHPLSADVDIPVEMGRKEPGIEANGYEKGVRDEPGTTGIRDRDAGGAGRDRALPAAPDQHFARDPQEQAVQEVQAAQEVTQQIPLSQGLAPAPGGDASESNVTPPVAFPRPSHTSFYDIDVLAEDIWDALPEWVTTTATRMTQGIGIRAGDTSSETTSQPTEIASMKPASQNKTVQGKENKKPRGKAAKPEKPVMPAEPPSDPLTPEERELYEAWCSLFHVDVDLTPSIINACQKLDKRVRAWAKRLEWTLAQTLDDMQKWNYANDSKDYYKKRGVKLYDLNREFEGWQSAKQEELRKKRTQSTETNELDRYRNSTTVIKRTEELRKRQTAGTDIPATPLVARTSTFSYDYR